MAGERVSYTIMIKPEDHLIYGAEAIGRIIKRDPREIADLVERGDLQAWKDGPKGKWRALCADLMEFNNNEKNRHMGARKTTGA